MTGLSIAQPDVTLFLDLEGVIRDVELSTAVPERGVEAWRGRPWAETVLDVGGDKVRRMVEDARTHGVSGFRQVTQRFPSGLELPVEYTTVRLGGKGGLVAIGKNLQAVAELQSRLIAAQQAMERDYWKLREVETRYRLLFDASTEAVLLVRASNLRVVEANPAAIRALGLTPAGRDLLGELAPADREPFQAMLVRVREHGKAPGVLLHLGREGRPWLVRASLIAGDPGPAFLVQLDPGRHRAAGARPARPRPGGGSGRPAARRVRRHRPRRDRAARQPGVPRPGPAGCRGPGPGRAARALARPARGRPGRAGGQRAAARRRAAVPDHDPRRARGRDRGRALRRGRRGRRAARSRSWSATSASGSRRLPPATGTR